MTARDLHAHPAKPLQRLPRFDTTKSPGAERECVEWVDGVLQEAGALRRRSWQRIRSGRASSGGCGTAPPLMLQAHVTAVLRAVATGMQPAGDIVLLDCPSFRSELEAHVA